MNLTDWTRAQGVHVQPAYRWYREVTLLVPARKAGRLILVSPEAEGAGLYAQVSLQDQKPGLVGHVARLSTWAAAAGLPTVRVEADAGSWVNRSRAKVRRLQAGPGGDRRGCRHRDRLGQVNTELAEAALSPHNHRLVVLEDSGVTGDLVRDMAEVLIWFCAGLCGRRPVRNRALKALGCARQDIGSGAVKLQAGGAV